jgi:hypothetical protein
MTEAASQLPRPPLYGIGSCRVGSDYVDFEIGWDEFERDTDWAENVVTVAGLGRGDLVLVTAGTWECPWVSPVMHALRRIGVTYLTADVYNWDARRVSMFLQRLPVKALLGLGAETLTALAADEPPLDDLLRGVEFIWARHDAMVQLAGAGPHVVPFVQLGPALAMGLPGRPGAVVDGKEWRVENDDGFLVVSNVAIRAARFDRVHTGVKGTVRSVENDVVTVDLADLERDVT